MTLPANQNAQPTEHGAHALGRSIRRLAATADAAPTWLHAALIVALGVLVPTLMVNRYLMVFGQPNLGAFGDNLIVGLMQSVGLVLLFLIVLACSSLAAPMLTRRIFAIPDAEPGIARHLNARFDGQFSADWIGCTPPRPLLAFLALNTTLYGLATLEIFRPFVPATPFNISSLAMLAASPLAALAFTFLVVKPPAGKRFKACILALLISVGFVLTGLTWLYSVLTLLDPRIASPAGNVACQTGLLMIGTCMAHLLLGAASSSRAASALLGSFLLVVVLLFVPGHEVITFNALRASGAGGGVVNFYLEPDRRTLGGPVRSACLILSAGAYRIVRLTDQADDCSAVNMRKLYNALRQAETPSAKQALVCGIVAIPRQAFDGTLALPVATGKETVKPEPRSSWCP